MGVKQSPVPASGPRTRPPAGPAHPLLWVAAGASLWGTDTILRRPLTASLTSAEIVLIEHLILTAVLVPLWWRGWRGLRPAQWGALLGIAWGGSALGTLCFTEAVRIGNPTTAILLQKSQPLFAALLARALLGERLGRRFWILLGLASGAAYLVSFGAGAPPGRATPAGTAGLLALAAAALWGASTVLGRLVLRSLSFYTLTALRISLATPLLLMLALLRPRDLVLSLAPRQVSALVAMALVPGLLALLIYYRGLGRTRAALAAIAELSFPATATLLNWLLLGTRISVAQCAGFVLLWGVILCLEERRV